MFARGWQLFIHSIVLFVESPRTRGLRPATAQRIEAMAASS
jgi:hypothetical protein